MKTSLMRRGAACAALLLPALAEAHPGHGLSFTAGAWHPLSGFDHLAALLAAGLLAGRLGGRARLAILSAFPALLALGAMVGLMGIEMAITESAILVSAMVLALLAAAPPRRLPVATATLAATFALFHGHAHGTEASAGVTTYAYVCGIIVSSVLVLCASASFGALLGRRSAVLRLDRPT